ncbi:BatA domain-containing protein, partial [Candidatus Sumerlaeota bacterium]|nr:BatA domain-containing protein [Candidatus Sumerlaeota bacterium]
MPTYVPIALGNPWMLVTLVAAAGPLIIHLISRQRSRRLPIPTLRFLIQTDRKTARKHKLADLVVLVLRTALLASLSLALTGPY